MTEDRAEIGVCPHFVVIGAEKAGTTTLHELLDAHREISMSQPKEPAFFCTEQTYAKGWGWYQSFFRHATGRVLGEATPDYAIEVDFPGVPERIAHDIPHAKIIYIVRHPIRRLESAWMWYRAHGRIRKNMRAFPSLAAAVHQVPGLLDGSLYWRQLSFYRKSFSDEQIKVLFLEDLQRDPQSIMAETFAFLGVDSATPIGDGQHRANESSGQRMDTEFVVKLRNIAILERLRAASPDRLRAIAATLLQRKIHERPTWDERALAWTQDQLRSDVASLLAYTGKPADYWDLDDAIVTGARK